eukprot:1017921-Alexandrium_andersonii.AAC.1
MDLDWDDALVDPPAAPQPRNDEPPQPSVIKRPATGQATKKRPAAEMEHGDKAPRKRIANLPQSDDDSSFDETTHRRREPRPSNNIVNPNNDPTSIGAVTQLAKHRDKSLRFGHQKIT